MKKLLLLLFFIPVLTWAKTVTYTYATLTDLAISGATEHTLVIPPNYPSYSLTFSCTFQQDSYKEDVEEPDDDVEPSPEEEEEEEIEVEDGEGGDDEDGDDDDEEEDEAEFATTVTWSLAGSGVSFAPGSDPNSTSVTILFTEGNVQDVVLTVRVTVECTEGNGVGIEESVSHTTYSPIWDVYHSIGMYIAGNVISAPRFVAVGDIVTLSVQPAVGFEYDRRQGADISTPIDAMQPRWTRPAIMTGGATVGNNVTWTASNTPANMTVSTVIDDTPYPKPANERGTTDDEPCPLNEVQLTAVAVARLIPDLGKEIDDGDNNPDTRTFVVGIARTGVVTVTATSNPDLTAAQLPAAWMLTGGDGTGKLSRTIDRTRAGTYTLTATCGSSQKITKIMVVEVESLEPNIGREIDDGDDNPDTRTFVVSIAETGVVTVNATANPNLTEEQLPSSWQLLGSGGRGKLSRTIDRTKVETYIFIASCGSSSKLTKIIVVEAEKLEPDIGREIDDDDMPSNTRIFAVRMAEDTIININATPCPILTEAQLPADWTLTGGTGAGKLTRTIDGSKSGAYTLTVTCGSSQKTLKIIVYDVKLDEAKVNKRNMRHRDDGVFIGYEHCVAAIWNSGREINLEYFFRINPPDIKKYLDWYVNQGKQQTSTLNYGEIPGELKIKDYRIDATFRNYSWDIMGRLVLVVVPENTRSDYYNWVTTWAYNIAWLAELPAAYTALGPNNSDPEPNGCPTQHWEEPTPIDSYYHPGAAFEMRSIQTPHGHGHQACYDNEGNLIRTGVSAGTADNRHKDVIWGEENHRSMDVLPFVRAAQLDGNPVWVNNVIPTNLNRPMMHNGSHLQQYLNLRPPIPNSRPLLLPGTCGPQ